jgi:hypothetical protein
MAKAERNGRTERRSSSFRLVKWYLDLVADDGTVLIGTWSELGWGPLVLRQAAVLADGPRGHVERSTVLRPRSPAVERAGHLSWQVRRLGLDGRWTLDERSVERTLAPLVRWHCRSASSKVELRLDGRSLHGLGYVERLELETEPWRLGLQELRWGRANGGGRSVVWIDWRGARPLSIVLVDGTQVEPLSIDDASVRWRGGSLAISQRRTLRSGPLRAGPLRAVPILARLAPIAILDADETKWSAQAELSGDGSRGAVEAAHDLFVVHELVRFPAADAASLGGAR